MLWFKMCDDAVLLWYVCSSWRVQRDRLLLWAQMER